MNMIMKTPWRKSCAQDLARLTCSKLQPHNLFSGSFFKSINIILISFAFT